MKIKIYYRKNLKLSPQKLAAVCTHIGKELGKQCGDTLWYEDKVVILSASDKKFDEYKQRCKYLHIWHLHIDAGFTEVEAGTECAIGWVEED